ncbi:MAG: twin-arginine translocase subunit TatC [Candidatus Altiarchaeota archaeon]
MAAKKRILDHLEELRSRVLVVLAVVSFLSILLYPFSDDALAQFKRDLLGMYHRNVVVLTPIEAVAVRVKTSILLASVVASPLILYHAFMFLFPALSRKEKNLFLASLGLAVLLFALGCLFAYLLLLPVSYRILIGFAEPVAYPMFSLEKFIDLSLTLILVSGAVFEWPLIAGLLSYTRIVSPAQFADKRRYAILAIFILAAIITDPSLVTQLLLGIPMLLLYEAGIIAARFARK